MKTKKILLIILLLLVLTGCKNKTYTVTFDTNGGTPIESIKIKKGETIKNAKEPTKEGYLFVSWLKDNQEFSLNTPITEDITLLASWITPPDLSNYYSVTLKIDGKEEVYSVKENELLFTPTPPKKEYHDFVGWYVDGKEFDPNTKITEDTVIEAQFKPNTVKISYDLAGGVGMIYEVVSIHEPLDGPDPMPERAGHKFIKFTLDGKDFEFGSKPTKDITLTAVWEQLEETVNISFDTDGGNKMIDMTVLKGGTIEILPDAVKEGRVFKEWQLDGKKFDKNTKLYKDIELKAIYK